MKGYVRARGMALVLGALLMSAALPAQGRGDVVAGGLDSSTPATVDDLKAIQTQVQKVLPQCMAATVGLRIGNSAGSGVIIDAEGHVLTAGHVLCDPKKLFQAPKPDQPVDVILSEGRVVKGRTLGCNGGIDSGMVRITTEGKWPYAEMGDSEKVRLGQWCIAVGHPGGYKPGRAPVVRLGRVLAVNHRSITTDCTLVGGDSGGPLFDLSGRVLGIHSRIGNPIASNFHVPVDTYRETWERLSKGEVWGGMFDLPLARGGARPYLGVIVDNDARDCKVAEITAGSPAARAGLQIDDVIVRFDGKRVRTFEDLATIIREKKIGDKVEVQVRRGESRKTLRVTLTKRPEE